MTTKDARKQLKILADWHRDQAQYPIDVSGSDRSRASRVRFHETAAKLLEALITTIKEELVLLV